MSISDDDQFSKDWMAEVDSKIRQSQPPMANPETRSCIGCFAMLLAAGPATLLVGWAFSVCLAWLSPKPSLTPAQTQTQEGSENNAQCRHTAYKIMKLDGYDAFEQAKMVDGLSDSIKQCCEAYHCRPDEVVRAATQLRTQMRAQGQNWSTTFAANVLITVKGTAGTIDAAVEQYARLNQSTE